jgi:hypothetical protein
VRCLSCKYDLSQLTSGGEHRCPECGRAFDPDDPSTFDSKRLRNWPSLLCIVLIGVLAALYGSYASLFPLMPPHEIPLFWQFAAAVLDGCLAAVWIVFLLLVGFALGRWRYRR